MSEITVEGSCLCGAVQYRISGEAKRFYHCHCKRCRKAGFFGNPVLTGPVRMTCRYLQSTRLKSKLKQ